MSQEAKGFAYSVTREQLDRYRKWPVERRLQWLLAANKMRKSLPARTIQLQDDFRNAKI